MRLPLAAAAVAHRAQEGGDATGSIVLAASAGGANCKDIAINRNAYNMLDNNRKCSMISSSPT